MNKDELLDCLGTITKSLQNLSQEVARTKGQNVHAVDTRNLANEVSRRWFEEIEVVLGKFDVGSDVVRKYHIFFERLLKLSTVPGRKTTYLKVLGSIESDFRDDLVLPVSKSPGRISGGSDLRRVLENVLPEEKEYLEESLGCASYGFFRASVVLAWSAAIHRMHKVVESKGLDEFNKKSLEMKSRTEGRFKRFNKSFHVQTLSELRASIFDNDLLWVLEYWDLIDSNQHERLVTCLTMRNNSAHPGEAPITEENLASFFSDLRAIVFQNPKFSL